MGIFWLIVSDICIVLVVELVNEELIGKSPVIYVGVADPDKSSRVLEIPNLI
jgi:hypothetical protein